MSYSNNYDNFSGADLKIADRIQLLRLNMLVHSCIYYELDRNMISDMVWDSMAKELASLQAQYPNISEKVMWYDAFKNWDGSTGMDLPLKDKWVLDKAYTLLGYIPNTRVNDGHRTSETPSKAVTKAKKGRLF